MRPLIWFRSDLRVHDNPALARALERSGGGAVAVFACCPGQWRRHDWGPAKVDFLLRSLRSLSGSLEELGVPLRLTTGTPLFDDVPARLLELAREHGCDALFFNREYEVNEKQRDQKVREAFRGAGLAVERFHDQTIIRPDALETTGGKPYSVYSPFRRSWLRKLDQDGLPEPLASPGAAAAEPPFPADEIPDRLPGFAAAEGGYDRFPAGEQEATERLESFLAERAAGYDDRRDFPAEEATSTLSPYLALGVLSPRTCLAAAVEVNEGRLEGGRKGIDTWISQLVWREFYRHVLVGFPRVSKNRPFRPETEKVAWRRDEKALEAWKQGLTGVPFVDAGMRQLKSTGWMHNRLRMVAAMYLTKDLLIDWRLGEQHFMRELIDGDLANNNGGWQWSASTGTDAAPYFRIFNPWTQGKRFDPEGKFIRRWLPELQGLDAATLHDPARMRQIDRGSLDYPSPLVDHKSARIKAIQAFESAKGGG